MSDRNQPAYNPNHYSHQVAYGQPGAQPRNGQQGYQQPQQSLYYPVGTSGAPYAYPLSQGQPDAYGMVPAYPMAQGSPQGYAMAGNEMGHFMSGPDPAPWANPSQNAMYYGSMDPARALTPQPIGSPSWASFPMARSSTPQSQMHGQGYIPYPQHIALPSGDGMVDSHSDQPNASGKFLCPTCRSPHARKADLQRHIRSVHTQESPYRCLGCGSGFVRSDARGTHWKNEPACKAEHSKREGSS